MKKCLLDDAIFKQNLLDHIREIKDYPKKGILFRDITTLLQNQELFGALIKNLALRYEDFRLDFVVGIESRGFIFGSALAYALGIAFVPIRKKGKLPSKVFSQEYALEYGVDCIEIHQDAFASFSHPRVLLIDDLIATGGTAQASLELIKQAGGLCVEACFLMNLSELGGASKMQVEVFSILEL